MKIHSYTRSQQTSGKNTEKGRQQDFIIRFFSFISFVSWEILSEIEKIFLARLQRSRALWCRESAKFILWVLLPPAFEAKYAKIVFAKSKKLLVATEKNIFAHFIRSQLPPPSPARSGWEKFKSGMGWGWWGWSWFTSWKCNFRRLWTLSRI